MVITPDYCWNGIEKHSKARQRLEDARSLVEEQSTSKLGSRYNAVLLRTEIER